MNKSHVVQLKEVVEGVLSSMSSAQKSEVQAWEEEIVPCTHTTDLVQPTPSTSNEKPKLSSAFEPLYTDSSSSLYESDCAGGSMHSSLFEM